MVLYKCPRCTKEFTHKSAFTKHLNRKKPCATVEKEISSQTIIQKNIIEKTFSCEFCGKFFSRKDNLQLHKELHCKKTKTDSSSPSITPSSQNDQIATHKGDITVNLNYGGVVNEMTNIDNSVTNNYYMNLLPLGQENARLIDPKVFTEKILYSETPVYDYIVLLRQHACNQNGYITDPTRQNAYILKQHENQNLWLMQHKTETSDEIYNYAKDLLLNELKMYLIYGKIDGDFYDGLKRKINDGNEAKKSNGKIKYLLYNQRDAVQNIRKNGNQIVLTEEPTIYKIEDYKHDWKPNCVLYSFEECIELYFKHLMSVTEKVDLLNYVLFDNDDMWIFSIYEKIFFNPEVPEFHSVYYKHDSEITELPVDISPLSSEVENIQSGQTAVFFSGTEKYIGCASTDEIKKVFTREWKLISLTKLYNLLQMTLQQEFIRIMEVGDVVDANLVKIKEVVEESNESFHCFSDYSNFFSEKTKYIPKLNQYVSEILSH